jgi:hypothetical protein
MAYPIFPDIQKPSYQYDISPEDPGIMTQMEDGSIVSRARFTRSRLTYLYHWNAMPDADKVTLLNFYQNTVKGVSQICTWNGIDGRISSLRLSKSTPNHWAVELAFQEA